MNSTNKIANAIGNIDDRFILEAFKYRSHLAMHQKIRLFGAIAASLCFMIGAAALMKTDSHISAAVYAYESNEILENGKTLLMSGRISDDGEMQGHPLMFYVLGNEIESIRFSCKNEWISFVDWTEQREDYGLSKNFTVSYGSREEDYSYLVIDWIPQNIIRKLTDNRALQISDLSQDEKEDMIVMEIFYLNGETETVAIWITLNDNGKFETFIDKYQITEKDEFVYQPDCAPIEHQELIADSNSANLALSDEELARMRLTAEEYYTSINRKMLDFTRADPVSSFNREYEGYGPDEVVLFEVSVENSENKRYIAIGSKDGWNSCIILNEGY